MKEQKGITLTSLVIYIIVVTIIVSTLAVMSSHFFLNANDLKYQDKYAVEFNKFNMFFINDVKNNNKAQVEDQKIVFDDGTTYTLEGDSIYRDDLVIATKIQFLEFTSSTYKVPDTNTTKNLINVHLTIGDNRTASSNSFQNDVNQNIKDRFDKTIEYVLKYW